MQAHPFDLSGQTLLVVGAGSGIGAATARLASQMGGTVLLAGRTSSSLTATQQSLANPAASAIISLDYLDPDAVNAALSDIPIIDHVLIPAVADENIKRGAFLTLEEETMRRSFDKFWGSIHILRAVAYKMPAGGSATLFASIAGIKPAPPASGLSVMNSVQAAVMQLGRSLALELAPRRVNVIAPGVVLTNVWTSQERAQLSAWMEKELPVRRAGEAEDIAKAALGLLANPYITGAVLTVDGGLHLI